MKEKGKNRYDRTITACWRGSCGREHSVRPNLQIMECQWKADADWRDAEK